MKSNRRLMCAVAVPLAMALATLPSISSAQNVKLTYPDDFALAEAVLLARRRGRC